MEKKSKKSSQKKNLDKLKAPPLQSQATDGGRPGADLALGTDSTSVTEISIMSNERYSAEIIGEASKEFDLGKLRTLKEKDPAGFLSESQRQILTQYSAMEALATHTSLFIVRFLVNIGDILNEVEDSLPSKTAYMLWLRGNFDDRHRRYFQQAKQLARNKEFSLMYAAAGKERILQLDRLRKELELNTCEEILAKYPLPDLTEDEEGSLLKLHIDAVVTHARLSKSGIKFADFDQAILIASYEKKALSVTMAEDIEIWLNGFKSRQRKEMFDRLVMDKLSFPPDSKVGGIAKDSLNTVVSNVHEYFRSINLDDDNWLQAQREVIDTRSLLDVRQWINILVEKLDLTQNNTVSPAEETPN